MPSEEESRLLALVRAQALSPVQAPDKELPVLDPGVLLSREGRRELQAAREVVGVAIGVDPAIGRDRSVVVAATIAEPGTPNANGDIYSEQALHQMMMASAAEEVGDSAAAYRTEVMGEFMPNPEEIEFDQDFTEGAGAPNEAVRFQVGREDPPQRSFGHPTASSQDGMVVSQRGPDGRFQAQARVPRNSTMGRAIAEGRVSSFSMGSNSSDPRPTTIRATNVQPSPASTCWERLNGPDPFDD